ncbi:MAG: phosphatidate cytidylyltransferase [Acidimicrobiales bacterium]|nr:phosphatidate cytidylyltransferase [Acidimicrobiales bacterium]
MDQDSGAPPPEDQEPEKVVREPTEGVRIIGAEEAAEASSRPDVVGRIPADRPKFGDPPTSDDAPPPPLRFPAPEADDPNTFGAVPIISADSPPPPGVGSASGSSGSSGSGRRSSSPFEDDDSLEFDAPPPPRPTAPVERASESPFDAPSGSSRTMAGDEDDLGRMLGGRRDRREVAKEDIGARRRGRRGRRGRRDDALEPSPFEDLLPTEDEVADVSDHDLPHWSAPPTGEVPKVLAPTPEPGDEDDASVWAPTSGAGPRWQDEHGHAEADDFSDLTDITRIESVPGVDAPVEPADEFGAVPPPVSEPAAQAPPPGYEPEPAYEPEPGYEPEPSRTPGSPYPEDRRPHGSVGDLGVHDDGSGAGRDLPTAVGVGVGLFVGFVVLAMIGTAALTLLVLVVIVMGAIEFFNAVRRVGYHPAVLPGLVATGSFVLAVHWKPAGGFQMVTFLTIAVLMLWYVIGLQHERAVANIGITLLGVLWIGGLGSFAALMLAAPDGIGMLTGAIIATVAYDVGAYFVGRQFGKTPLSPSSPNKTMEGLVGGAAAAVVVSVIVLGIVGVFPWDTGSALILGLAVAIVAPVGDLCESMLKRDLGLKDMGSILPGHGGLLDRFDALLFVLPVTYYVFLLTA